MNESPATTPPDFSLVTGGPLWQAVLRRCGRRAPSSEVSLHRMVAFSLFAWLPLVALAVLGGCEGTVSSFLLDLDTHTRLVGAMPLLLGTEVLVHRRIRDVVARFVEDGIVAPSDRERFDALLASAVRWRNSPWVEVLLLVLACTFGHWLWQTQLRSEVAAWCAVRVDGTVEPTAAGRWYACVSLPILRFLLFRWYYRLGLWYVVAWRISRLPLCLHAAHPDRAGGLGFLVSSVDAFTPFVLAHTVPLAGMLATRILHGGASLLQFRVEIVVTLLVLVALVLTPILFFRTALLAARRREVRANGAIAVRLAAIAQEPGSDPVDDRASQALARLADLERVGSAVERVRTLVLTRGDLLRTTGFVALPLAPLSLTVLPFEELVNRTLDVFF